MSSPFTGAGVFAGRSNASRGPDWPGLRQVLLGGGGRPPTLDLDFVAGVYSWSGASHTSGDFSVSLGTPTFEVGGLEVDSGDRIAVPTMQWFNPQQGTFEIEWYCDPAQAQGTVFSLSQGSGGTASRFEIARDPSSSGILTVVSNGSVSSSNAFGVAPTKYARALVAYSGGEGFSGILGGVLFPKGSIGSVYALPSPSFAANGIGYRVRFGDIYFGILTSDRIRKIKYWPQRKSDAFLQARALITDYTNIHAIGDSFVGAGQTIVTALKTPYAEQYRVFTSDGVGGSSLADQKLRFDATPQYYDRTLIIDDGGLSDTLVAAKAAIDGMVVHLPHNRWFYVQPGIDSTTPSGTQAYTDWQTEVAAIAAYVGSNHYIPTLAAMQAAGDGSANDNADIANGIWPRSLRGDTLHPNAAGQLIRAAAMKAKIDTLGY